MVRPSRRGGVPVLRRHPRRPSFFRDSPSRMAAGSPERPAGYCCSPQWMSPLRKVPVVMMTAAAPTVRPSRRVIPRMRRRGEKRRWSLVVGRWQRTSAAEAAFIISSSFGTTEVVPSRICGFGQRRTTNDRRRRSSKIKSATSACLILQIRLRFQDLAHFQAVGLFVALGAGRPDGGAARCVQQAELDADGIGDFAHDAAEGVDFADEVAFGNASDGGVAGHLRDQIDVEGVEGGLKSHASAGYGGLAAGVSGADDDDVEIFGELHGSFYFTGVVCGLTAR